MGKALVFLILTFSFALHAEAYTIQVQGMGTSCDDAINNARNSINQGDSGYTGSQQISGEFDNFLEVTSYCIAVSGASPVLPAEGVWMPVGTYPQDQDSRCSIDPSGNHYTQQKFYGVCPG